MANIQEFIEKIKTDENLAKIVSMAKSAEELLDQLQEMGYELDLAELLAALKPDNEISDDAMEGVAGGILQPPFIRSIPTGEKAEASGWGGGLII